MKMKVMRLACENHVCSSFHFGIGRPEGCWNLKCSCGDYKSSAGKEILIILNKYYKKAPLFFNYIHLEDLFFNYMVLLYIFQELRSHSGDTTSEDSPCQTCAFKN